MNSFAPHNQKLKCPKYGKTEIATLAVCQTFKLAQNAKL